MLDVVIVWLSMDVLLSSVLIEVSPVDIDRVLLSSLELVIDSVDGG